MHDSNSPSRQGPHRRSAWNQDKRTETKPPFATRPCLVHPRQVHLSGANATWLSSIWLSLASRVAATSSLRADDEV